MKADNQTRRYNFQRIRNGVEMAEGVAVHAVDIEEAVVKAHTLMRDSYPPDDHIRFIGIDPCAPLAKCTICERKTGS
jgi:hypothetical protein